MQLKEYTLYSITGSKVDSGSKSEIPTTVFSPDLYVLKLDFNDRTIIKKVVIN